MPIEIKELHIRVTVDASPGGHAPGAQTAAAGRGATADAGAKDALVAECVEQVLQILQNKLER
jgi:hypothetical protein